MSFLKTVGQTVNGILEYVGDKNRKAAYLNRIRTVIRCEEKAAEREYLALGRYFYGSLRDRNNPVTEAHCAQLDAIEERLEKALSQLEEYYRAETIPAGQGDADACGAEEITLDDVESYDHDPTADTQPEDRDAPKPSVPTAPAEPGENDNLPFE